MRFVGITHTNADKLNGWILSSKVLSIFCDHIINRYGKSDLTIINASYENDTMPIRTIGSAVTRRISTGIVNIEVEFCFMEYSFNPMSIKYVGKRFGFIDWERRRENIFNAVRNLYE